MKCNTNNRFEQQAKSWDKSPLRIQLANAIAKTLFDTIKFAPTNKVLDYGAGTGVITLQIASFVSQVVAMDSSPAMLQILKEKIEEQNVQNVQPETRDLENTVLSGQFDVVFSSMTMHHIQQPLKLLQKFMNSLNNGGTIAIADVDTESGNFHADNTGVKHFGFDRESWVQELSAWGMVNIQVQTAYSFERENNAGKKETFSIFLITAQKK